jgi:hypothetical protein
MNDLASDACYNDETYIVVYGIVDEARKLIAAMRRAQNEEKQKGKDPMLGDNQQAALLPEDGDAPPSSSLKNPPRTKPKGRLKEKEKHQKPLIELREEANEKRRKQKMEPKKPKEPKQKKGNKAKKVFVLRRGGAYSARMQVHGSSISKGRR